MRVIYMNLIENKSVFIFLIDYNSLFFIWSYFMFFRFLKELIIFWNINLNEIIYMLILEKKIGLKLIKF